MTSAFLKYAMFGFLTLMLGVITFLYDTTFEWALSQLPVGELLPDAVLPYTGLGAWIAIKLRMDDILAVFVSAFTVRVTIRCIPFVGRAITGA